MKKDNLVPKIRFKGFSDPWEQRKLKSISNRTVGGGTPATKIAEYWNGEIPWIQSSNIVMDDLNTVRIDKYISNNGLEHSAAKLIDKNSIAVITRVGVGKLAIFRRKYATSQDFLNFSELNGDIYFLGYLLYQIMNIVAQQTQGTSIKGVTKNDLLAVEVAIPRKQREQLNIGSLLHSVDNLIAANEDKLNQLKELKKLLMQKIFSQEWRFKGFTDPWEQRKLGELGLTYSGLSGKTKKDFGHGGATFVTYMNVYSHVLSDYKGVESVEIDSKQREVEYGDIFFTVSSETPAEVAMSSVWLYKRRHVYLNSFCFGYRFIKEPASYLYWGYYLRSAKIRHDFSILAQGISRYNISKSRIMKTIVDIPDDDEQIKVGLILNTISNLIAANEEKLVQLKKAKKFLMQNMFA